MPLQPKWEPKFPTFADEERAVHRAGPVEDVTAPDGSDGSVPWVEAPATSHLWGFRYFDAREHRFLRRFFGGKSHLDLRFRPSGKGTAHSDYRYEFADPEEGERVFAALKASARPWSEVGRPELIGGKVPYHPIARG